jgi:hypothetical protein
MLTTKRARAPECARCEALAQEVQLAGESGSEAESRPPTCERATKRPPTAARATDASSRG